MSVFTSGPLYHYIGINTVRVGTPRYRIAYLGLGETAPNLQHRFETEPVMSDATGSRLPRDNMFQGEIGVITLTLTDWVSATLTALERKLNNPGVIPGTEGPLERGSLLFSEGLMFPLYLVYGHALKATMIAAGMPAGRRYPFTYPEQIVTIGGRKANKRQITFLCHNGYNAATRTSTLWDENVAAAAAIPPVG